MTSTLTAVSQAQSLAAMRNFIRASVSCIAYARGLCSDASFERRAFLGMSLHYMLPSSPEAMTLSHWLERGAFDALNRGYLREAALCVYDAACTRLFESYSFAFAYSSDGQAVALSLHTSSHNDDNNDDNNDNSRRRALDQRRSKHEVQRMLSVILAHLLEVVERLPPLLDERVLTMRLVYRDAVTPLHYEPPCFAPATAHMRRLYREEQAQGVHLGIMHSGHHDLALTVRHPLLTREAVAAAAAASLSRTTAMRTSAARRHSRHGTHNRSSSSSTNGDHDATAQPVHTSCTSTTYVPASSTTTTTACGAAGASAVVVPSLAQLVREASASTTTTTWSREAHLLALLACLVFARSVDGTTTTTTSATVTDATLQRCLHACATTPHLPPLLPLPPLAVLMSPLEHAGYVRRRDARTTTTTMTTTRHSDGVDDEAAGVTRSGGDSAAAACLDADAAATHTANDRSSLSSCRHCDNHATASATAWTCVRAPLTSLVAQLLTQRCVHERLPRDCYATLQRYVAASPSARKRQRALP